MVGGRGVRLARESVVREAEFFLALDPREGKGRRGDGPEPLVRVASLILPEWLEGAFPGSVTRERTVRFDADRGRVVGFVTTSYRDLPLREEPHAAVDPAEAAAALANALSADALGFVRRDEAAASWLDRLDCLRAWMPERDWPEVSEELLAEVVATACLGKRAVDEARKVPLLPLLKGCVPHATARAIDDLAPETVGVPSGSRLRLVYEPGRPPGPGRAAPGAVRHGRDAEGGRRADCRAAAPARAELPAGAGDGRPREFLEFDLLPGAQGLAVAIPSPFVAR